MISIQEIINWFREENPNKSESTYNTMKYNIIRLEKITKKDIDDLCIGDFENISKVKKSFETYALNTKIQTVMGIKLFLRFKEASGNLIDKWNEELKTLCGKSKEIVEKNEMTENEEKNWIDYMELSGKFDQFFDYKFFNELQDNTSNDYTKYKWVRDFLLLALYVELPPARIGNYQFMKIREEKKRKATSLDKKYNYLMVNTDGSYQLVFNQYKTAKYLGQIHQTIKKDSKIATLISTYLPYREIFIGKKSTDFLLNKEKRTMTQSNITDTLKFISRKVVGKDLSVNLLRHIYITYYFAKQNSIEEKRKIANFMGQTYDATMMEKYNKLSKKVPAPPTQEQVEIVDKCIIHFD